MSLFIPVPASPDFAAAHYRPQAAIVSRQQVVEQPLPLLEVGTGGMPSESFVLRGIGYQSFVVLRKPSPVAESPYAALMAQAKAGFGRTMSRLPEVFGVSRQTLYNWLEGETPKAVHQERLKQLAAAAEVFAELGIKPTSQMLDRTVAHGQSFLKLMASGAEGRSTAQKLVRIVERGSNSRAQLAKLLSGRKTPLTAADIGPPALNEDA
jgi:hypothetical protein